MTGILNQEFIRVARAKGLSERRVVWRYALANAIGPIMTVAGLQVGYLFGSIIVVETLFNYTGMGWITYQALLNRDVPLIETAVFVIATVVMLVNFLVDLLVSRGRSAPADGLTRSASYQPKALIGLVIIVGMVAIAIAGAVRVSGELRHAHADGAAAAAALGRRIGSAPTNSAATCSIASCSARARRSPSPDRRSP